jgi:hypothetical protein
MYIYGTFGSEVVARQGRIKFRLGEEEQCYQAVPMWSLRWSSAGIRNHQTLIQNHRITKSLNGPIDATPFPFDIPTHSTVTMLAVQVAVVY